MMLVRRGRRVLVMPCMAGMRAMVGHRHGRLVNRLHGCCRRRCRTANQSRTEQARQKAENSKAYGLHHGLENRRFARAINGAKAARDVEEGKVRLARALGLEPRTLGFGDRCSTN